MGLWGCGSNAHGQLGTGDDRDRPVLVAVATPDTEGSNGDPAAPARRPASDAAMGRPRLIALGGNHSVLLDHRQVLWGCGSNVHGQLGRLRGDGSAATVETADVVRWRRLLVALPGPWQDGHRGDAMHDAALDGSSGSDGDGDAGADAIAHVACSFAATFLLTRSGHVWAAGSPANGLIPRPSTPTDGAARPAGLAARLAHAGFVCITAAWAMRGGAPIVELAVGVAHGLGRTQDGAVIGWGDDRHGQAGGTTCGDAWHPSPGGVRALAAVALPACRDGAPAVQLATSKDHSLVRLSDGSLWFFGRIVGDPLPTARPPRGAMDGADDHGGGGGQDGDEGPWIAQPWWPSDVASCSGAACQACDAARALPRHARAVSAAASARRDVARRSVVGPSRVTLPAWAAAGTLCHIACGWSSVALLYCRPDRDTRLDGIDLVLIGRNHANQLGSWAAAAVPGLTVLPLKRRRMTPDPASPPGAPAMATPPRIVGQSVLRLRWAAARPAADVVSRAPGVSPVQLCATGESWALLVPDGAAGRRLLTWGWNEHGNCGQGDPEAVHAASARVVPSPLGTPFAMTAAPVNVMFSDRSTVEGPCAPSLPPLRPASLSAAALVAAQYGHLLLWDECDPSTACC
ncbi:hypothetical protein CXG81DRAFT_28540 [Caulochytrium protostelioides]|nr:hypothetical protein CXG81DRAFT_28540 [Caulochytrium protostelioides]|eukprot:RKO98655.1 hypothetical protein CXG81DRAFT_28540 [Caulochytrium protostelioides]